MLFSVVEFDNKVGRIIFSVSPFEQKHDSFRFIGKALSLFIGAKVIEEQLDADLHSWLILMVVSLFPTVINV